MKVIERETIGEAWQAAFNFIMENGNKINDEDQELIEFLQLFLIINFPDKSDSILEAQDPSMRKWMLENFTEIKRVPELKNSWSYGWRLLNYQGVNQIDWVIDKLKKKPESKSATINMLQKAGEESYIPCVSLLDFKIRENTLLLSVTCRSLDFGQKAIHNLFNLAKIAKKVADSLKIDHTRLNIHIISAHIYKKDWIEI